MYKHILESLSECYPQLLFPLSYDTKDSIEYKNAVLRGQPTQRKLEFTLSPEDSLAVYHTPAGQANVLFLSSRDDFEHCVRVLAYRCEPRPIPESMGACTVRGLINWEKIRRHQAEYLASGRFDWTTEFRRFTAEKSNYLDSIVIISSGYYSAVTPEIIGLPAALWREKSIAVRTWHELTHFVCRALYPDDVDAVRDEVFADMIGLISAFGSYDTHIAKLFLGVEGETYRFGGRLKNYLTDAQTPEALIAYVKQMIALLKSQDLQRETDIFAFLLRVFDVIRTVKL